MTAPYDHEALWIKAKLFINRAMDDDFRSFDVKRAPVTSRDGWWPLDDDDEYDELSRWPVLSDDFVRGPPAVERRQAAETA